LSTPPPGWQPDPQPSPQLQSAEVAAAPAVFAPTPSPSIPSAGSRTLTQRNSASFTAICVAVLYLVLAATTGVVLIGIFPGMLALRAFQRREPLALVAAAAAAVAIVSAMTVLTRH